jgi:sirohydrochlorin cobaltochelatase
MSGRSDREGMILFGHGARDPRWAEPFHRLRDAVVVRRADAAVMLAFLEMMEPDLDAAADALIADECTRLTIVPIFFGQGSHLRRDLPEKAAALRARWPDIPVTIVEAAGEDPLVIEAIADYCARAVAR